MSVMERSRPLVPVRESESSGVTYAEVRFWAVILRSFTVRDLADSMAVDESVAERGITALLYQGIVRESRNFQLSLWGDIPVYEYVPLPPGPTEHETGTPPWMLWPCGSEVLSPRGLPIRIRTQRDQRGGMSTPGSRQKLKNRERAYQRQKEARESRAEEQRRAAMEDPKWKKVRRGKVKTVSTKDMP